MRQSLKYVAQPRIGLFADDLGGFDRRQARAVPVVGGCIALFSAKRAVKVARDGAASKAQKAHAMLRAVADAMLVVQPLASAVMNVALVLGSVAVGVVKGRRARRAAGAP